MGEDVVVTAALSIGANWMKESLSGYGPDAKIFENGLKTAIAAALIAKRCGKSDLAPLAYTGGLLHDIGKAVLSEFLESGVSSVIEEVATGHAADWLVAEKEELGVDHCEVGGQVADHFNLGPALRAVIAHHHIPSESEPEYRDLVKIVHVADGVRAMMGGDQSADALSYPVRFRAFQGTRNRPFGALGNHLRPPSRSQER